MTFANLKRVRDFAREAMSATCVNFFCGSGVTQDRTGLGWSVLNQELAIESKDRARKYIESILNAKCDDELFQKWEDILEEFYLSDKVREEVKASVTRTLISSTAATNSEDKETTFNSMISKVLYRGSGWSRGRFLDSIVELCCYLASSGKSVNILTTNYDDYIEAALTKRIRRSYEDAVSKVSKKHLVGLRCQYYDGSRRRTEYILPSEKRFTAYRYITLMSIRLLGTGSGRWLCLLI